MCKRLHIYLQNIKPNHKDSRLISVAIEKLGGNKLKYEEWLRRIIKVVSNDYKIPEEEKKDVWRVVKERITEIFVERKILKMNKFKKER